MKHIILTILLALLPSVSFAEIYPVSMEQYYQDLLSREACIRLRNNTNKDITSAKFIIKYYDIYGSMIDYKEFDVDIEIKPHLTKTIKVPAYGYNKNNFYYKDEPSRFGDNRGFDVRYQFVDYTTKTSEYFFFFGIIGIIITLTFFGFKFILSEDEYEE